MSHELELPVFCLFAESTNTQHYAEYSNITIDCSEYASIDLTFRICIGNQRRDLCSVQQGNPDPCKNTAFPGRVTYLGGYKIAVRNMTPSESGTFTCYDAYNGQDHLLQMAIFIGKTTYLHNNISDTNFISTDELLLHVIISVLSPGKPAVPNVSSVGPVIENNTVVFICQSTPHDTENITYRWTRQDGEPVAGSQDEDSGNLTFSKVHRTDHAEYICTVTNVAGDTDSSPVQLVIHCE